MPRHNNSKNKDIDLKELEKQVEELDKEAEEVVNNNKRLLLCL